VLGLLCIIIIIIVIININAAILVIHYPIFLPGILMYIALD